MTFGRWILIAVLLLAFAGVGAYTYGRWSDAQESRASATRANAAADAAKAETERVRAQGARELAIVEAQLERERAGHPVLPPFQLPAVLPIAPPPIPVSVFTASPTGSRERFPLGLDVRLGYPLAWEVGADWEFRIPMGRWALLVDPAVTAGPTSGSLMLRMGVAR